MSIPNAGAGRPLTFSSRSSENGLSPTVVAVYERLLREILAGGRPAGSTIKDLEIANELGVSRTPVREALLLLRSVGVIEVSASRFTRVAIVDLEELRKLSRVCLTLYCYVVEELAARGLSSDDLAPLERAHAAMEATDDLYAFVQQKFRFFEAVAVLSDDTHLLRALDAVIHALHLGMLTHLDRIRREPILHSQALLIAALRAGDPAAARAAIDVLRLD